MYALSGRRWRDMLTRLAVYKNQLEVATKSVTVTAGSTASGQNIDSAEANVTAIWQYGEFDGTPSGFLNAECVVLSTNALWLTMSQYDRDDAVNAVPVAHIAAQLLTSCSPSDSRMHDWVRNITVGQQDAGYVPMAVFKAVGALTIRFALASGQGGARTLEIGTTLAFAGARPQVQVNSWTSAIPALPTQPDSRGVTRGTWRGNVRRHDVVGEAADMAPLRTSDTRIPYVRWILSHHLSPVETGGESVSRC